MTLTVVGAVPALFCGDLISQSQRRNSSASRALSIVRREEAGVYGRHSIEAGCPLLAVADPGHYAVLTVGARYRFGLP